MTTSPGQCTCTIVPGDPLVLGRVNAADPMAFRIERCQLHAAAGLMRDALTEIVRHVHEEPFSEAHVSSVASAALAAVQGARA